MDNENLIKAEEYDCNNEEKQEVNSSCDKSPSNRENPTISFLLLLFGVGLMIFGMGLIPTEDVAQTVSENFRSIEQMRACGGFFLTLGAMIEIVGGFKMMKVFLSFN